MLAGHVNISVIVPPRGTSSTVPEPVCQSVCQSVGSYVRSSQRTHTHKRFERTCTSVPNVHSPRFARHLFRVDRRAFLPLDGLVGANESNWRGSSRRFFFSKNGAPSLLLPGTRIGLPFLLRVTYMQPSFVATSAGCPICSAPGSVFALRPSGEPRSDIDVRKTGSTSRHCANRLAPDGCMLSVELSHRLRQGGQRLLAASVGLLCRDGIVGKLRLSFDRYLISVSRLECKWRANLFKCSTI